MTLDECYRVAETSSQGCSICGSDFGMPVFDDLNGLENCLEAIFGSEQMSTIVSAFVDAGTLRGDQCR